MIGTLFYPQHSLAKGFTGKEFAEWATISQDSYIQSSVMMAGVIGTRVKPEISRCIDEWYFADVSAKARANAEIKATIAEHESFHPSGVILAVIQQKCGSFEQ
ncbi:MAG: hypothetical protein AAFS03_02015 [Pseudomonadota bacterium]